MKLVQEKKAKRAKSAKEAKMVKEAIEAREAKEIKEALEAKEVRISNVTFPPMDSTRLLPPLFYPTRRIPSFLCWLLPHVFTQSNTYHHFMCECVKWHGGRQGDRGGDRLDDQLSG